jgi:predicted thioesterase
MARRAIGRVKNMDETRFTLGSVYERTVLVTHEMTAAALGNEGVEVLATPILVQYFEMAAVACIESMLDEGEGSVGTSLTLQHLAATPVGGRVRFRVELKGVTGRRIGFDLEAADDAEVVATGHHERVVVNLQRFLDAAAEKLRRIGGADRS